jgi:plastocyanin
MSRALGFSAVVLAAVLAGPAFASDHVIFVGHNRLEPAELKIAAGDTVVFHNQDSMPGGHTVQSEDGELQSPPLALDGKWSHTFEKPGKYRFRIREHPDTHATVVVE